MKELFNRLQLPVPDQDGLELFQIAFTHKSYLDPEPTINMHYDRLEFFGDSILKYVINEHLFDTYTDYNSGRLTKLCSYLLSDKILNQIAHTLDLAPLIKCKKHIKKDSLLADVMESIFAVVHISYGLDITRDLILRLYSPVIPKANLSDLKDNYKAALQEHFQGMRGITPDYVVISREGEAHEPTFEMAVQVASETLGTGVGASKKDASQNAAHDALQKLGLL